MGNNFETCIQQENGLITRQECIKPITVIPHKKAIEMFSHEVICSKKEPKTGI